MPAAVRAPGRGGLWIAVACLLALAGFLAWLVVDGLGSGETVLPLKQASLRRAVLRDSEPVMFWFVIGLYTAAGAGSLGLGLWMASHVRRPN